MLAIASGGEPSGGDVRVMARSRNVLIRFPPAALAAFLALAELAVLLLYPNPRLESANHARPPKCAEWRQRYANHGPRTLAALLQLYSVPAHHPSQPQQQQR